MPKQKRWGIKQTIDTAIAEISKAQDRVAYVKTMYDDPHPDLAQELLLYFQGLEIARQGLQEFRDKI